MGTGGAGPFRAETGPPVDPTRQPGADTEGLGSLVTGIVEDLQRIVRGEVQLAKTELKEDLSSVSKGIAAAAIGGIIVFVGFIFLMLAVTFLINKWLDLWISAGIVAIVLLVIGIIALLIGKQRLSASNLKPEQTIESLKEDQQWASRQAKSVNK